MYFYNFYSHTLLIVLVVKDTAQNAVVAPIQGAVVGEVINTVAGVAEGADIYEEVANNAGELHAAGMFIFESFFQ